MPSGADGDTGGNDNVFKSFGMTLREKREREGIEHGPKPLSPQSPKMRFEGWIGALNPGNGGGLPGFNLSSESPIEVYAVIERGSLILYPGEPSLHARDAERRQESLAEKLKVLVLTRGCKLRRLSQRDAKGYKFAFLVGDGRRSIILVAGNEGQEQQWLKWIQLAAAEAATVRDRGVDDSLPGYPPRVGSRGSSGGGGAAAVGNSSRIPGWSYFGEEDEEGGFMHDALESTRLPHASAPSYPQSVERGVNGGRAIDEVGRTVPLPSAPSFQRLWEQEASDPRSLQENHAILKASGNKAGGVGKLADEDAGEGAVLAAAIRESLSPQEQGKSAHARQPAPVAALEAPVYGKLGISDEYDVQAAIEASRREAELTQRAREHRGGSSPASSLVGVVTAGVRGLTRGVAVRGVAADTVGRLQGRDMDDELMAAIIASKQLEEAKVRGGSVSRGNGLSVEEHRVLEASRHEAALAASRLEAKRWEDESELELALAMSMLCPGAGKTAQANDDDDADADDPEMAAAIKASTLEAKFGGKQKDIQVAKMVSRFETARDMVNEQFVLKIQSMGFGRREVVDALLLHNGDYDAALDSLLAGDVCRSRA